MVAGYNDLGNRVHRGKKAGGGTRPFSAPLEFKYYCGNAFPGGPLEATQVQFETAEGANKEQHVEARDDLLAVRLVIVIAVRSFAARFRSFWLTSGLMFWMR